MHHLRRVLALALACAAAVLTFTAATASADDPYAAPPPPPAQGGSSCDASTDDLPFLACWVEEIDGAAAAVDALSGGEDVEQAAPLDLGSCVPAPAPAPATPGPGFAFAAPPGGCNAEAEKAKIAGAINGVSKALDDLTNTRAAREKLQQAGEKIIAPVIAQGPRVDRVIAGIKNANDRAAFQKRHDEGKQLVGEVAAGLTLARGMLAGSRSASAVSQALLDQARAALKNGRIAEARTAVEYAYTALVTGQFLHNASGRALEHARATLKKAATVLNSLGNDLNKYLKNN